MNELKLESLCFETFAVETTDGVVYKPALVLGTKCERTRDIIESSTGVKMCEILGVYYATLKPSTALSLFTFNGQLVFQYNFDIYYIKISTERGEEI